MTCLLETWVFLLKTDKMEAKKLVSYKNQSALEKTKNDTEFYRDIRFWMVVVLTLLLFFLVANSYPVIW